MTPRRLGIFGARGHGRDMLTFARSSGDYDEIVFIDDEYYEMQVCGEPVVTLEAFSAAQGERDVVAIAVSDGRIRETLSNRCQAAGLSVVGLRAIQAVVSPHAAIAEGAVLSPFSVISSNVRIGKSFQANTFSSVAHDCIIGDYVTLGPGALLSGCIHVEDYAYIGSGAVIRQGSLEQPRRIGKGAIIGMGAVVLNDIPAATTVVGNPAGQIVANS